MRIFTITRNDNNKTDIVIVPIDDTLGTPPRERGILIPLPPLGLEQDSVLISRKFIEHYGKKFSADIRGEQYAVKVRHEAFTPTNIAHFWCRLFHWRKWYVHTDPENESTAFLRCPKCAIDRVGVRRVES